MAGVINKLRCMVWGHKRGKRVAADLTATITDATAGTCQFQCPRCKAIWSRKAK